MFVSSLKDTTESLLASSFRAGGPQVPALGQIHPGGPSPALTTVWPRWRQPSPETLTEGRAGVRSLGARCRLLWPPQLILTHEGLKHTPCL